VRFTVLPTKLQKKKAVRAVVIDLRFSSPVLARAKVMNKSSSIID
jgi:hypothetical protein